MPAINKLPEMLVRKVEKPYRDFRTFFHQHAFSDLLMGNIPLIRLL